MSFLNPAHHDISCLGELETNLQAQVDNCTYDLENNLAILKLYQLHPDATKPRVLTLTLVKALMQMPHTDFLLLTYLVPDQVLTTCEPVRLLVDLNTHLEKSEFVQFWQRAKELKQFDLDDIQGFETQIREFIVKVLQCAYRRVPRSVLALSLNMEEGTPQVGALVEERGWKAEKDLVQFPLNADNQERPKKFKETIQFDQLTPSIRRLTAHGQ